MDEIKTTKRLEIVVTERQTADGRKFNAYHTFSKNGRRTDVKFRQDVQNKPTEHCFIEVLPENMNLNTSGRFPVLWVKAVEEIVTIESVQDERAEENRAKIDEYFG